MAEDTDGVTPHDLIVIGGSLGAPNALRDLFSGLPPSIDAAILVVIHIPPDGPGIAATVGVAAPGFTVVQAEDGMELHAGIVYVARPDRHLMVRDGRILLGVGPRENLARPSVDALFRSAAAAYGPRVIGVLLSGLLNDGASGLAAIKRCGGLVVLQDPADAEAPDMPDAALRAVTPDAIEPGRRLGPVLGELAGLQAAPPKPVPQDILFEVETAAGVLPSPQILAQFASPSMLTCPHCGGVMSEMHDAHPLRYRCHVGHALTAEAMASAQEGAVDEALRVALRVIDERAELVARMSRDADEKARPAAARAYATRADEYRRHAESLRRALVRDLMPPHEKDDA